MSFSRIGLNYFDWIEREAEQSRMEKRVEAREIDDDWGAILPMLDEMFFTLRFKREQWTTFVAAAKSAGDLTAEEMVTEALQVWMKTKE